MAIALPGNGVAVAAMAGVLRDARAPGVSDAMRRRIGASLDAGELPQMRGTNLRLGTVVLQRADGRDAPALAEVETQMRRRNIPTDNVFNSYGRNGGGCCKRGFWETRSIVKKRCLGGVCRGTEQIHKKGREKVLGFANFVFITLTQR